MTKPPKDGKRGGGLGLELKTHDKIGSKKPAADERKRPTGREVFQWMLNGRS